LIEKFINEHLPHIPEEADIKEAFEVYWTKEQEIAFENIIQQEKLSKEKTKQMIEHYLFSEQPPMRDEVLDLIDGDKPTILERKKVGDKIYQKIMDFINTFIFGYAA
jgi:type I restriction enzyme R subunit